jgi:hypothetical protein
VKLEWSVIEVSIVCDASLQPPDAHDLAVLAGWGDPIHHVRLEGREN